MAETNLNVLTAQEAFLKITDEQERLAFIGWCRKENDRLMFQDIGKATDEGIDELKETLSKGADQAKKVGSALLDAGKTVVASVKQGGDNLEKSMRDFLGKDKA